MHFKGFQKIESLEKYSELKSIWLESNGIDKIEGLEHQTKLRMLYLHQNSIAVIENLSHLTRLVNINLSNNKIKEITGLEGLNELRNIDLVGNIIANTASCAELLKLPSLGALDLSNNLIDDHENVLDFFGSLPSLNALKLKGNPAARMVSRYRKNMVARITKLNYLDDRPVMKVERM